MYCSNAIVSLNCYTAKCGRRNAEVRMGVASQARLPWLSSPHFIMFSGYQFNKKSVPKIRSHFINKQRHPFWPFSSLTWCCVLLLHKCYFCSMLEIYDIVLYCTVLHCIVYQRGQGQRADGEPTRGARQALRLPSNHETTTRGRHYVCVTDRHA